MTRGRGKGLKRDRGTLSLSFPEMGGGELSSWGGELNTGLTVLVNPQADRLNCWRYSFCHMQSVICNLILAALSLFITNHIRRSATIWKSDALLQLLLLYYDYVLLVWPYFAFTLYSLPACTLHIYRCLARRNITKNPVGLFYRTIWLIVMLIKQVRYGTTLHHYQCALMFCWKNLGHNFQSRWIFQ